MEWEAIASCRCNSRKNAIASRSSSWSSEIFHETVVRVGPDRRILRGKGAVLGQHEVTLTDGQNSKGARHLPQHTAHTARWTPPARRACSERIFDLNHLQALPPLPPSSCHYFVVLRLPIQMWITSTTARLLQKRTVNITQVRTVGNVSWICICCCPQDFGTGI